MPSPVVSLHGWCFNSRLREEATCDWISELIMSLCFNSRLREEATKIFLATGRSRDVSTHASVRRRQLAIAYKLNSYSFNSRLREEATRARTHLRDALQSFNSRLREEATVDGRPELARKGVSTHASVRRRPPSPRRKRTRKRVSTHASVRRRQ